MKKIDQLREQMKQVRSLLVLMPAAARDALFLTIEVMEEQQQQIDNLTLQLNRLTAQLGEVKR